MTSHRKPSKTASEYSHEWDAVWDRGGSLNFIVSVGRSVYNYFFFRMLTPFIKAKGAANITLLEIGCGTATLGLSVCKHFLKLKRYTGVDISESALALANKNAKESGVKNYSFLKGDCFALPAPDESFDIAWSQGLIEHLHAPGKAVMEHHRVIKHGGRAFVIVPAKFSYHYLWWSLTRVPFLRKLWPWTDQIFYTRGMLGELIAGKNIKYRTYFVFPCILGLLALELRK